MQEIEVPSTLLTSTWMKGRQENKSNNACQVLRGNSFLVPGATLATILMLGALHARHIYEDKKIEEAREKGVELEFHPDVKASFLGLMPLRSISRLWGSLTSVVLAAESRCIEDAIRCGGLAPTKSSCIKNILKCLIEKKGKLCLEYLRDLSI
ncbi:unnamed protein product [Fraxinus pennsylvanica]|uniref:Uncharacterized protein n=1 Tax=Fraxinus pennsylvanica TaxID=56036 RepID=A0AAD1Z278_9LAMI|nr:unnamed protein product [Fraxinus pennsylvanica]